MTEQTNRLRAVFYWAFTISTSTECITKFVSQKVRFTMQWFDDAIQDLAGARLRPRDDHLGEEGFA